MNPYEYVEPEQDVMDDCIIMNRETFEEIVPDKMKAAPVVFEATHPGWQNVDSAVLSQIMKDHPYLTEQSMRDIEEMSKCPKTE